MKRALRLLALSLIRAYQRWVSPAFPRRCKYEPTCSAYAAQAVRELGLLRGGTVAAWRLLRCNPFSDGGIDDLCDRRLFRPHPAPPPTPPSAAAPPPEPARPLASTRAEVGR